MPKKVSKFPQDIERLHHTIEQLPESDIIIMDFDKQLISKDYLDYLLEYLLSKKENKNTLIVLEYNGGNYITLIKRYKVNFDSHSIKKEV